MSKTFGFESTTDEVLDGVDLTGKRILVTGVSAGLGVETARALVAHGAHVVGAARDLDKARRATEAISELAEKTGGFELVELDLASLNSVRAAADALIAAGKPFDVVIANAGVMATPKGETADGFETQFGTNHLGHFVFVNRIAALIKPGGASGQSVLGRPPLCRRRSRRSQLRAYALYDPFVAYGRSKTANILFAVEFDRRHKADGIRATAVHPGGIQTELGRHMTDEIRQEMAASIKPRAPAPASPSLSRRSRRARRPRSGRRSSRRPMRSAASTAKTATSPSFAEGKTVRTGVRAYALDPERAKALWAKSEEMVGERFA